MSEIVIDVIARLDKFESSFSKLEKSTQERMDKLGDNISKGFDNSLKSLEKRIFSLAGALASAFAFHKVVSEASNAEEAMNNFNSSLALAGKYSSEASDRFEKFARKMSEITRVEDDSIIANGALLVSLGRLSGEGLERATKAALDLQAGMQGRVSLEGAFDAVAKAAAGNLKSLSALGIKISETVPPAERFGVAMEKINFLFGGQAESKVNTFAGAMAQMGNTFTNLLEDIGNLVVKSPVVVAMIKEMGKVFSELGNSVRAFSGNGDFVGDMIKKVLEFGPALVNFVMKPLELLFNIGKLVFYSLAAAAQAFIFTIVTIPAAFADVFGIIIQGVGKIAGIVSIVNSELGDKLQNSISGFGAAISEKANMATAVVGGALGDLSKKVDDASSNLFVFDASAKAEDLFTRFQTVANGALPAITEFRNRAGAEFGGLSDDIQRKVDEINKALQGGLIRSLSAAGQAIGASLLKGKGAFDDFKKVVLGIIGDMAIQIGTTLIGIGIGIDALKTALGTLTGGIAIAAGLALVAIGGLLKSIGGEGIGASAGTAGAGGVGQVGSGSGSDFGDVENQKPGTVVHVNVQGNLLNRKEEALHIVEAITDIVKSNGAIIPREAVG